MYLFNICIYLSLLLFNTNFAVEPLEFECVSEPNDVSITIDCQSNKEVEITCYLDDIEQDSCKSKHNTNTILAQY